MTKQIHLFAALLVFNLWLISPVYINAAPGDLDASFGSGGVAEFQVSNGISSCCMEQQADGKLLVAGARNYWVSDSPILMLRRYNADGSPDTSFGFMGEAVAKFVGPRFSRVYGWAHALKVQSDGKILVAGYIKHKDSTGGSYELAAVWRFTATGVLDASFDGDGEKVFLDVNVIDSYVGDLEISRSGQILVAYNTKSMIFGGVADHGIIAQLNSDGSFDTAFGSSGKIVRMDFSVSSLSVYPRDGAIYAGGLEDNRHVLIRYRSDGTLQTNYGNFGVADLGGTCFEGQDFPLASVLELQSDGKAVLAGTHVISQLTFPFIVRFNTNGNLDPSFGSGGILGCTAPSGGPGLLSTLKIQSDGKIVTLTAAGLGTAWGFKRYHPSGQEDTTFIAADDPVHGHGLLIQSDGKIIVLSGTPIAYKLRRYLP